MEIQGLRKIYFSESRRYYRGYSLASRRRVEKVAVYSENIFAQGLAVARSREGRRASGVNLRALVNWGLLRSNRGLLLP